MATASSAEPFSIRGFAERMRAVDAAKCWPFGRGRAGELQPVPPPPPQLPPVDPPRRSRWWVHELAAERARLAVGAAGGEAAGGCGGKGGALGKGTKRKGSRGSGGAERSKKQRLALQFSFFLKHKEKTSKPQSTSRLLQHVLHKGLLRKRKNSTIHTWRELAVRKKLQEQEIHDHMSTHENSLNMQRGRGMDPSNDMNSSLFRRKTANSFVNKRSIKVSRSTNYPLNLGCEVGKHVAYPPKDDIFGDLPLLESSKIMFQTGVDELRTVIDDSFVTNQSGPGAISETAHLKLMPASDFTAQTSSPFEDLVKKEGNPDKESTCIFLNDAGRSDPFSAGFDGPLNHRSVNMVKTCLGDMQLKSTGVPALSSYSNEGPKSGSSNPPQGCFYTNTNCCQEIKKPGTNYATSLAAVRTRTEATKKDGDAAVNGKKNTDISGPLVPTEYHLSSEGSVLSSAISQGTVNTGTNTDGMSSCRSMPAQEYVPTSTPFGIFASNVCHERKYVDTCTSSSMEEQGNWYSKLHPVCTPASIGLAFMKLPGLERMEFSSCNLRTGENTLMNGRSVNTIRCQKQQLVSGVTNIMQGRRKNGFSDSQAGKKDPDDYVRQDVYHSHQPTVRLMGKTVSVCKPSKEQKVSTMGKVWTDSSIIKEDHLSSISCQLAQKRLFPCQDSAIPRAHVNESSDILPRIPNSTLSEARSTISDVQNQKLQRINSVSSTVKDRIWNSGSQFVCQTEVNKASMISANSRTRHLELHRLPQVISIPQNQHTHVCTPASSIYREDHNFVGPAVNQSTPSFPQWVLNTSMQGKYQKSTSMSYDDPSSVPIRQPCQVPGAKLSSTSIISFHDYGTNNAVSRNSYQGVRLSLPTSLASDSISTTGPTCIGSLSNIDVRKVAAFVDQRNKRPAYTDNVSQQPAKRQLVTYKQDLATPVVPNMKNHSLGWSLNDAVGPRILDFSNNIAGHATQIPRNENNNCRVSSGPVPVVETRSRAVMLVTGAKTMLKPGQNLNDHSKLLYSTKFSVDNGIHSVVL